MVLSVEQTEEPCISDRLDEERATSAVDDVQFWADRRVLHLRQTGRRTSNLSGWWCWVLSRQKSLVSQTDWMKNERPQRLMALSVEQTEESCISDRLDEERATSAVDGVECWPDRRVLHLRQTGRRTRNLSGWWCSVLSRQKSLVCQRDWTKNEQPQRLMVLSVEQIEESCISDGVEC